MRTPIRSANRSLRAPLCGILGVGAAVLSSSAQVSLTELTENNSLVRINPTSVGMYTWDVDGQDYLTQQALWYRVGPNSDESPVATSLALSSVNQPLPDQVTLYYTGIGFDLQMTYDLTGGSDGSGASDLQESIKIINTSGESALDFHLFLYTDFDLGGSALGDTVTSVDYVPFPLSAPGYNRVVQVDGLDVNETTISGRRADRAEAEAYGVTLGKFSDGLPTDLVNSGASFGPTPSGDLTYAFQWDLAIGAGASEVITLDKRLEVEPIPEPTTAALSLLGLAALWRISRRRQV